MALLFGPSPLISYGLYENKEGRQREEKGACGEE
jgi:hypothetical protein